MSSRVIRSDKKGFINDNLSAILTRLGLDDITWLDELINFRTKGNKVIGTIEKLKAYVKNIKQKIKMDIDLRPALEQMHYPIFSFTQVFE